MRWQGPHSEDHSFSNTSLDFSEHDWRGLAAGVGHEADFDFSCDFVEHDHEHESVVVTCLVSCFAAF